MAGDTDGVGDELLMLTRSRVARLSELSERRLDYWESTGLLESTVRTSLTGHRQIRLYDFRETMTAMVLSALRDITSLQHVRQIVSHLRNLEYGVTEVTFGFAGGQVHFQTPDGEWSGMADPGQLVIHQVLDLTPLRNAVLAAGSREAGQHGQIERRRGALGNKPVVAGTRVPVRAVQAFLDRGRSVEQIMSAYPSLTPDDVEAVKAIA